MDKIPPLILMALVLALTQRHTTMTSEEGGFQIDFPQQPDKETIILSTSDQDKVVTTVLHAQDDELDYSVVYHGCAEPLKNSDARLVLQTARDNLISEISGTLLSSREIAISGAIGLEFEIEYLDPKGRKKRLHERSCLANQRFYQVMVVGSPAALGADTGSRFLRSFSLIRPAAK